MFPVSRPAGFVLLSCLPTLALAEEAVDPGWVALRQGDLVAAEAAFEVLAASRRTRQEGQAGLLAVGVARGDEAGLEALLAGLSPRKAGEQLILAAGDAELSLREPSGRALAWVEAACALEAPVSPDEARELCSWAPLLRESSGFARSAEPAGLVLPFSYAGAQPVVLAAVNGGEPVPLLVDTGASTCLLTEQAASALGLARRDETSLQISATGGAIDSWRALVDLGLDGGAVQDVPVVVADLPITGLAGILSPQAVWPDRVVALDFGRHELRVAAAGEGTIEGVTVPWRQHGGRPYLELRAEGLDPRPVVIDTGASQTHLDQAWLGDATPLVQGEVTRAEGAGGVHTETIATTGVLVASTGDLALPIEAPDLYTPRNTNAAGVWNYGLLGAETWMGRTVWLDRRGGRIALSDPPALPPWEPGDAARFEVVRQGSVVAAFTERVVARDDGTVTLAVTTEHDGGTSFGLRTPEGWTSRGAWMFTRPVIEAWTTDADGARQPLADGGRAAWMALFQPFRTTPGDEPPGLHFGYHEVAGQRLSCTRLELPAVVGEQPARFTMLECPASPWRVAAVEVLDAEGGVIWGFRRVQ